MIQTEGFVEIAVAVHEISWQQDLSGRTKAAYGLRECVKTSPTLSGGENIKS